MRPDERDKAYLWDMLDAAMAIEGFVATQRIPELIAALKTILPDDYG